jgi:hypothetical protein
VKFEEYCKTYDKNKAHTKLQRQAGELDVVPIVIDRVSYGLLLKGSNTDQIRMELEYRGLATDGGAIEGSITQKTQTRRKQHKRLLTPMFECRLLVCLGSGSSSEDMIYSNGATT